MQPMKKTTRKCDQGFYAAKTFPAGVKETTSFLYPDFGKSIPHVINSQSTGGYVLANKNASPISRISFAESPNEKVVAFSFFANGSYILPRTPIFFCCFFLLFYTVMAFFIYYYLFLLQVTTVHKSDKYSVVSNQVGARDRKSTRLNSSHSGESRMPSSA